MDQKFAHARRTGYGGHESRERRLQNRPDRPRYQSGRNHPLQCAAAHAIAGQNQETLMKPAKAIIAAGFWIPALLYGQTASSHPDFSGVYYPLNPFGRGGLGGRAGGPPRKGPPPRPTQSAPIADGSQGRAPGAPSLTPEYLAKWEVIRKSRMAGSSEYDY